MTDQRRCFLQVLLVLFLLVARSLLVTAQAEPIPWEKFWQQVEATKGWTSSTHSGDEWKQQAEAWSKIVAVRLPDGQVTPVDTSYLVALLRQDPPQPNEVRVFLAALETARDRYRQTRSGAVELAALQSILTRPEFQWPEQQPNLLEELGARIMKFLNQLIARLFPDSGEGSLFIPDWLLPGVLLVILAAILLYATRGIWRNLLPEAKLSEEPGEEGAILTAQQATHRAQQLSSSGDFRQAIRYQYLAALLLLDEQGLVSYHRSLTNREVLRQVARQPSLASRLRSVIDTFDRVWYGFQSIDEAEYTYYAGQVLEIEREAKTKEAVSDGGKA